MVRRPCRLPLAIAAEPVETNASIALVRQEARMAAGLLAVMLLGWIFLAWAVVDMTNPLAQLMMPMDPQPGQ